ncbi:MAG: putative rane spanning protein [Bacteroidota bacterium]|nr:putative rane spanning protein [Bacteroidota bacterium]
MKKFFIAGLLLMHVMVDAQNNVGIGTNTPGASAKLDITATDKGVLLPRVALTGTTDAATITTPATSLLVYNTATSGVSPNNVIPGYYYNSGTSGSPVWTRLNTSASTDTLGWTKATTASTKASQTDNQYVTGNIGAGDFSGSSPSGKLDVKGNVLVRGINTNTPLAATSALDLYLGRGGNSAMGAGQSSADVSFQYAGTAGAGWRNFIVSRHDNVVSSNKNAIDFYLNNSVSSAASTGLNSAGTLSAGTVHGMSITATGVGIGTNAPNTSAILDIISTSKGVRLPNVALTGTTDAATVATPPLSLLVYNTATAGVSPNNVIPGFYYNSGTSGSPVWQRLNTSNRSDTLGWTKAATSSVMAGKSDNQYVTGNVGIGNFSASSPGANLVVIGNGIIGTTSNSVSGTNSLAVGTGNTISGTTSIAIGNGNTILGANCYAVGTQSRAEADHSMVAGYTDTSTASATGVYGYGNNVSGFTGFASGDRNKVRGQNAFSSGFSNNVNGDGGFASGQNNISASYCEIAMGANGTSYTAIGTTSFNSADRLLNIGNGSSSASRSDAFTIFKNGNVGFSASSPSTIIAIGGDAARTIGMERTTLIADAPALTLQAAGAKSGQTDKGGGDLILSAGIITGNGNAAGSSNIIFKTATPLGSSSSADQSPSQKMKIKGDGTVNITNLAGTGNRIVYADASGNLNVSSASVVMNSNHPASSPQAAGSTTTSVVPVTADMNVSIGDVIIIQSNVVLKLSSGDSTDDFFIYPTMSGTATVAFSNATSSPYKLLYTPDESASDHDNYKPVSYLEYGTVTAAGTLNARLDVQNTGDDTWEYSQAVLIMRKQ